ncbi:MAG: AAA family ATPase, partial [Deltaproteobacteria bacterium]|nr:AAA family ATPase [Deltaproteobacteria bacterium]
MLLLPLGVENFEKIRGFQEGKKTEPEHIYADKTGLLYNLLNTKSPYFLSRPCRFGKSLLIDTLDNILRGRRELFEGLQIYKSNYDWKPYPVIRLSLAAIDTESVRTLKSDLIAELQAIADRENLTLRGSTPPAVFKSLFEKLYSKYDREVAVLIDEYDAPILSKLHQPKLADKIRECLRIFYLVLKDKASQRGFTFITGVTKFAQASIFSSLNNLVDITLDEQYASICGFTEDEFNSLFPEYMEVMLERLKARSNKPPEYTLTNLYDAIKDWYDGYTWDGQTKVFNPWSILCAFQKNRFGDYWSKTGGIPSFLVNLVKTGLVDFKAFRAKESIT